VLKDSERNKKKKTRKNKNNRPRLSGTRSKGGPNQKQMAENQPPLAKPLKQVKELFHVVVFTLTDICVTREIPFQFTSNPYSVEMVGASFKVIFYRAGTYIYAEINSGPFIPITNFEQAGGFLDDVCKVIQ